MPVFVEDPTQFSKLRLKSVLISHNVELPPGENKKEVYVDLYMKHVWNKSNADFSSDDDEDPAQSGTEEEEKSEEADMVDLSSLTDDQLKSQLLHYGVKAGPIVGSTRALYERKLQRLMAHSSQFKVNGASDAAKYSDSEEDEGEEEEDEEDVWSGSEQLGPESVSRTETSATARTVGLYSQSKDLFYPQCFSPTMSQEPVTDILTELFPDTVTTPTGITATKRRSIKGAAGRPVQFKYLEAPLSPASLERREIQQRLVPLWVQIVVFLLLAALLYLIYVSMEDPLENPFSALLDSLSDEPALTPSSQDISTSEVAA
ncbi:hypothetical protein MHYP_G00076410 [Metynnis hypsauchen]